MQVKYYIQDCGGWEELGKRVLCFGQVVFNAFIPDFNRI